MEESKITFETAKLAKEKGFDEPTKWMYNDLGRLMPKQSNASKNNSPNISGWTYYHTCTQSLLQKWLREVHDIHFEIKPIFDVTSIRPYHITVFKDLSGKDFIYKIVGTRETYEETLEIGLQEALNLIPNEL